MQKWQFSTTSPYEISLCYILGKRADKQERINNDQQDRIDQIKEQLRNEKEHIARLEDAKKLQKVEYNSAMKQLNAADGEYRALTKEKMQQNVIKKQNTDEELDRDMPRFTEVRKHKVLAKVAQSKVTQLKLEIQSQKRK